MTEPVVLRGTFWIALLTVLRAISPPVIAVLSLRFLVELYGVKFDADFTMLAVLVAVLGTFLLQPPRNGSSRLMPRSGPLAVHIVLRWLLLLDVLFAIGYWSGAASERMTARISTPGGPLGGRLHPHVP